MTNLLNSRWKLTGVGVFIGIVYWILESFIDAYIFNEGSLVSQLFSPDKENIYMRLSVMIIIILLIRSRFLVHRQKKDEDRLKESETRFHRAFNDAPIGMALVGLDERFMQVNKRLCSMLGYSEDELVSKTVTDITYHEDCDTERAQKERVIVEDLQGFQIEKRYVHADGHIIWGNLAVSLIRDRKGKPLYYIGQLEDITERKQAEDALRAAVARAEDEKSKTESIIEAIGDGITIQDRDFRILYQNQSIKEMIGDHIGKLCYIAYEKRDQRCEKCPVAMVFEDGGVHTVIRTAPTDKGILYVENTASPMKNSKGEIIAGIEVVHNITERKQAENALQEKEYLLAESQRVAHIGSWLWEIATGNITWTEETYRIYGRLPGAFALSPESFLGLIHPDDRSAMQEWIRACLNRENPGNLEFRIVLPDGNIRYIDGRGDLLCDSENKPIRMVGTAQDITERKKAEYAIKEAELRFSSLVQTAGDAIIMSDKTGNILSWNSGAQKIFGYTEVDVIGKPLTMLMPERYMNDHLNGLERVVKTGQSQYLGKVFEFHGIRKDGTEFPLELSVNAWLTPKGLFFLGIIRDTTERRRIEETLKESQERLRTIINTEPHCVKLLNADGTLIEMNPAGLAMIEADSLEHVKGASLYSLLAPEHLNAFKSHVEEVFAGGSGTLEFEIIGLKGTHRWLSTHSVPFRNSKGEIIALLGITRDITEQRKLEDQLRQAQKIEAIGQLAGGVAHDFNNILSAIMGYTHLTLMKMGVDDPLRGNLSQILESSERAATLTHSLLAFSRKQVVSLTVLDLNDLVRKFEKFLLRLLREDIELKTICADPSQSLPTGQAGPLDKGGSKGGVMIMADKGQIEQVLMNLVTNARDAMPDGGLLTIKTERFELTEEFVSAHGFGKPGSFAMISVSDTGSGIDEETKQRIFEPFFTTKEVGIGTGLGLAMVYGIIKKHEGYINVYSEPGKGTTFRIYLPIVRAEAEKEESARPELASVMGGDETILLAEDDSSLRKLSTTVLRQYGYKIIEAENGEEAVIKFAENKDSVALVILDGIMPKKNGKEAYEEIKILRPDIKAIFVSGYSADIFGNKGVLDKETNFITKPVSPIVLAKKVRELLDK